MRKFFAVLLLAMACLHTAVAQPSTFESLEEVRTLTDKVMANVGSDRILAGLNLMKPYLVISAADFDLFIAQVRNQWPTFRNRFGEPVGYEFVRQEQAGDSLVRLTYMVKFEIHVLRWMFYWYKTPKGWVINSFKFDDNLPGLFPNS